MSEGKIFDLYRQLGLWRNPICAECKIAAELNGPISIWQVGNQYEEDSYRLVFVGKTAIGGHEDKDQAQLSYNGFINWTNWANDAILHYKTPYWTYTRSIIEGPFGSVENGWEKIAYTNMVKCNNGSINDTTSGKTAENCIDKLNMIWKELELLKPRKEIFYTHRWYDPFIERWTSQFECRDLTSRECTIANGRKRICWWERDCFTGGVRKFRLLRTSHPERQLKEPFVDRLVDWVRRYNP